MIYKSPDFGQFKHFRSVFSGHDATGLNKFKIQTKSHFLIKGDLKSGLVWIFNGPKEVGMQMVQILNGI